MTPEKGIEQAEVMRRWYEQKTLPESERDILEVKHLPREEWIPEDAPTWNFFLSKYRLLKRPQKKTVTVYLVRAGNILIPSLTRPIEYKLLGQADITYEETDDDTK